MTVMRTAMILDAGFASLPLQQAIKAAGFRTLACSGKAQDAGMKYADATCVQIMPIAKPYWLLPVMKKLLRYPPA
jgi:hypothetical protein